MTSTEAPAEQSVAEAAGAEGATAAETAAETATDTTPDSTATDGQGA